MVAHAGSIALRLLADRTGLTKEWPDKPWSPSKGLQRQPILL